MLINDDDGMINILDDVDNIKDINLKTIKKAHLIYEPSKAIKAALSTLKYKIKK